MSEEKTLPKGWKWVKLGEIAKWGSGGTPTSTNSAYYGGTIPWLIIGDLNDGYISNSEKKITSLGLDNSSAKLVLPDSVLIAMYGSIGKLGINKIPVATNQAIAFTEKLADNVYNKFLFHYLFHIRSKLHSLGKGGTQKNISQTVLKQVEFPLAPRSEQEKIVSKIEELLSELDNGINQLKTAQQQLKTYRQAVLKYAFDNINNPAVETVLESCLHIVDCLHTTAKFSTHGYYCIDTTCIENNKILYEKARYVDEETYKIRISRLKPEEGDILFSREGTVGTTLIVPRGIELCLGQRMMMFRFKEDYLPKYIMYYFQSTLFKKQYKSLIGGTTSPHLNIGDIKKMIVLKTPINEQQAIVNEIERRLSVADKLEETITTSLQQSESLRQSILKQAFEGKLVRE